MTGAKKLTMSLKPKGSPQIPPSLRPQPKIKITIGRLLNYDNQLMNMAKNDDVNLIIHAGAIEYFIKNNMGGIKMAKDTITALRSEYFELDKDGKPIMETAPEVAPILNMSGQPEPARPAHPTPKMKEGKTEEEYTAKIMELFAQEYEIVLG